MERAVYKLNSHKGTKPETGVDELLISITLVAMKQSISISYFMNNCYLCAHRESMFEL